MHLSILCVYINKHPINKNPYIFLVTGSRKHGVATIKFRRPLQTNDVNDLSIAVNRNMSVIAAIGPLNNLKEANAHSHDALQVNPDNIYINFSNRV